MINLNIPYFSQLDNTLNPYGSCNVTSIAMCLYFLGIRGNGNGQLEDQLYRQMESMGLSRHSPYDLAQLVRQFRKKDNFNPAATWQSVKDWLMQKKPIVVHGYFTNFGHIIVIRGFNEKGFIVNDPYGEFWKDGYDNNASGAGLTYSYDLMKERCGIDGDLWIHFIS